MVHSSIYLFLFFLRILLYSDHFYFNNVKIYSTLNSKSSIGGYYDSDKLICLNSSLQTNL